MTNIIFTVETNAPAKSALVDDIIRDVRASLYVLGNIPPGMGELLTKRLVVTVDGEPYRLKDPYE